MGKPRCARGPPSRIPPQAVPQAGSHLVPSSGTGPQGWTQQTGPAFPPAVTHGSPLGGQGPRGWGAGV